MSRSVSCACAAALMLAMAASGGAAAADAQAAAVPPAAATASQAVPRAVSVDGFVGLFYPPAASGGRHPAMLVLGGSEGGLTGATVLGAPLAKVGYAVLGVAYFGAPGLPANLQDVPLEQLDRAIAWLRTQPGVDPERIGVYGVSVGGELALLLASRHPELKAVVAGVPSGLVWQGINLQSWEPHSSFTARGRELPFVPYDSSKPFAGVRDLYDRSLPLAAQHPDAAIPVEKIGGPVLLISAGDDQIWPSRQMSDDVMRRLDAHSFRFEHLHLDYPDAGHGVATPPSGDPVKAAGADALGGTTEGNARGRADMWPKVLAFLDRSLNKHKD